MADINESSEIDAQAPAPTNDEIATQQAASGAADTGAGPSDFPAAFDEPLSLGEPVVDVPLETDGAGENAFSDYGKAFFRANIRWLMTEFDLARSGCVASEREVLNP